jgi:membrane protease YdiL (CAAX protease family)
METREFPPWSLKILFAGLVGFQLFLHVGGRAIILLVVLLNKFIGIGLSGYQDVYVGTHFANQICIAALFLFMQSNLQKEGFQIRHLWISFSTTPSLAGLSLVSGITLALLGTLVRLQITGEVDTHPSAPLVIHWIPALALEILTVGIMVASIEEVIFRGLVYPALRKQLTRVAAAIISVLVYTAYHTDQFLNPVNLTFIFLLGLLCLIVFLRSESLTNSIIIHSSFNITTTTVYFLTYYIPA